MRADADNATQSPWWARGFVRAANAYRRLLGVALAVAGPRLSYAAMAVLARWLYALLTPLRERSEAHCRAVLTPLGRGGEAEAAARRAFVHRVWNLADLALAERYLHAGTYARYGGALADKDLAGLRAAQRRGQPVLLLSAYYGPFDLWPVLLGYNGMRATVIYRRHGNAEFDAYRRRVRGRSGCELVAVEDALERVPKLLEAGEMVAIVADHHDERRGVPASFLGLPTQAPRTVGLFAWRFEAEVCVAGIRRRDEAFKFELDVADVIKPADWRDEADPIAYITQRYLSGLERIVLRDPGQYLWAQARWGEAVTQALLREGAG